MEGECEVETGRNIGADLIIAGDVLKLDGQYLLTLKLYATDSGNLLSATEAEAAKGLTLVHKAGPATTALLRDGLGLSAAAAPIQSGFSGSLEDSFSVETQQQGVVRFESSPNGAVVLVNGRFEIVRRHPARRVCRWASKP